jgi:hypothetical protein
MTAACSSAPGPAPAKPSGGAKSNGSGKSDGAAASATEGLVATKDGWTLHTAEVAIPPGQERFVCYGVVATEDMKVSRFSFSQTPGVHHFIFSASPTPSKEGLFECNVFELAGASLFAAATASVELESPSGSARLVSKGTQLVLQAHFLNTSDKPMQSAIEVRMARSHDANPEPVGILGFGSANIDLPPGKTTTVESICTVDEDTRFFAVVPHMHYLGRKLELDFGPDESSLETIYARDPFSFDDQRVDSFVQTAKAGTVARVRCTYDNETDHTVHYGASSTDEMCVLSAYVVGQDGGKLCTRPLPVDGGVPPDPNAPACGTTVTASGIGSICTRGAFSCESGLTCTADHLEMPVGICVRVGCGSNSECEGTTCCTLSQVAGLANFCVPEGCRPASCIPVSFQ